MVEDKTIREFIGAIKEEPEIPSTTQTGVVSRIDEEGTVWVYLSGSDRETPTAANASEVKRGDAVNVEWRNNRLYISGNYTDPSAGSERVRAIQDSALQAADAAGRALVAADSAEASAAIAKQTTDEINAYAETAGKTVTQILNDGETAGTAAQEAKDAAQAAQNSLKSVVQGATTVEKAVSVMQTALEAVVDYDPQNDTTTEYFWHDANGAHVLGTSGDYRNDITSTGMEIVDTSTEEAVAKFGVSGAQVGKSGSSHVIIGSDNFSVYNADATKFFGVDYNGSIITARGDILLGISTGDHHTFSDSSFNIGQSDFYVNHLPTGTVLNFDTSGLCYVMFTPNTLDDSYTPVTSNANVTFFDSTNYGMLEFKCNPIPDITIGVDSNVTASVQVRRGSDSSETMTFIVNIEYDSDTGMITSTGTILKTWSGSFTVQCFFNLGYSYTVSTRAPSVVYGTNDSTSRGDFSSSFGEHLYSTGSHQTALGKYNIEDVNDTYAAIIGNGIDDNARSNALTVDWSGNVEAAGDIEDGSGNVLANKADTSAIPTATSELTNDSGFITGDWTLQGTVTGGTNTLTIPETAKEAYVYTKAGNGEFTKYVYVKGQSIARLEMGGYYISTSDNGLVNLNVSNSNRTYQIRNARYANIDYKSSAVLKVYYR